MLACGLLFCFQGQSRALIKVLSLPPMEEEFVRTKHNAHNLISVAMRRDDLWIMSSPYKKVKKHVRHCRVELAIQKFGQMNESSLSHGNP